MPIPTSWWARPEKTSSSADGNDFLEGRHGDDDLDGGQGFDRAIYAAAEEAIWVSLATGWAANPQVSLR